MFLSLAIRIGDSKTAVLIDVPNNATIEVVERAAADWHTGYRAPLGIFTPDQIIEMIHAHPEYAPQHRS